MTGIVIILTSALLLFVVLQIARINELAKSIRGEEEASVKSSNRQGVYFLIFLLVFVVGVVVSAIYYKNYFLGYGPHQSASAHGVKLDWMFQVTLIISGIVFFITQIALFYFAYRYRYNPNRRADFIPHNNKLEYIWTTVPAVAMTLLVVSGLFVWNDVMVDVNPEDEAMEIEATGMQFNWIIRYPGPDGALGAKDFRLITGLNPLGQNWGDLKNLDDFQPSEIVLPKGRKIRVRITARDVLHNFYLPHFRVKMDAVPGMPTYFVFTPEKTTEEYRQQLSSYPEYQVPAFPEEADSPMKWEVFNYELACAELCGSGHYSMRRILRVVEEYEFESWLGEQQAYYFQGIRGSSEDPYQGQLFDFEIQEKRQQFNELFGNTLQGTNGSVMPLSDISFIADQSEITQGSGFILDNLVNALHENPSIEIEIRVYSIVGEGGEQLAQLRADGIVDYLTQRGIENSRIRGVGSIDGGGAENETEIRFIRN